MREEAHAALDRLLEAVRRAMSADSEGARVAARRDARRYWVDLARAVDREGVLSEAYQEAADEDVTAKDEEGAKREFMLNTAARVLSDLSGDDGAFKGRAAGALAWATVGLIDLIQGRVGTGAFDPLKQGRGNRKRSVAAEAAWRKFARLVHYRSGRDGVDLEKSFGSFGAPFTWARFRVKQRAASTADRRFARDVGKAVRARRHLTHKQVAVKNELEKTERAHLGKLLPAIRGRF